MWTYNTDYLSHHGILGQKWGVRRFQNPDGSLTPAGKKRYGDLADKSKDMMAVTGSIAKSGAIATGAIAGVDALALLAGSSTIMLPVGPFVTAAAAGSAYLTSLVANKYANKKLRTKA